MKALLPFGALLALTLTHCGSSHGTSPTNIAASASGNNSVSAGGDDASSGGTSSTGGSASAAAGSAPRGGDGNTIGGASTLPVGGSGQYPDTFDPNDSPPKIGEAGCGFDTAAFCDTFGGASKLGGRSRELDSIFWSAGRMFGAFSTNHAMPLGMAQIPDCRPDLPGQVWTAQDTLICNPTFDVASGHLLSAVAAQNYGQHGFRIRQPFDFTGRTGKIVFDGTASPLNSLRGWISLAITEDPISLPGYSLRDNDEGSIIPRNAVEIHFLDAPGQGKMAVRNVHVFRDYEDTFYTPPNDLFATYAPGKLNHIEVKVSTAGLEISISPTSADGLTFDAPMYNYKVNTQLPFSRGYVHLSVHNHATIKYTQPDSNSPKVVDASVALFDNVGFDGNVIANWREYEVPDSLLKIEGDWASNFQTGPDPYNTGNIGYDIGYQVADQANAPKQTLKLTGVDPSNAVSATLATNFWAEFRGDHDFASYTLRARLNGKNWIEHKFTAKEAALLTTKPVTRDASGAQNSSTGNQGRYALLLDVPVSDLVPGDNTLEFTTANVPTSIPPVVCNVDLILKTQ
ncbi:MAG TPA: hypothetical protein VFK05_26060 [Polyangiaceae bacterium]|nr:hypothetical protein [Polyangiaceae bacterium]